MPMHRTICIFLACLVTSACTTAEALEESTTHYPGEPTGGSPGNVEMPTDKSRSFTRGAAQERRSVAYGSERVEQRRASFEPLADACGDLPDPCCGPMRAAGSRRKIEPNSGSWSGIASVYGVSVRLLRAGSRRL
jgi:hypothetical protein